VFVSVVNLVSSSVFHFIVLNKNMIRHYLGIRHSLSGFLIATLDTFGARLKR